MAAVYQSPWLPPSVSTPTVTSEEWWYLFDDRVVLLDVEPSAIMAYSTTSNNRRVRASLSLVAPPSPSVVQLYTDDEVLIEPSVVATDDDLLLVHMVVPFKGRRTMKCQHNFFVFKVSPESPWMQSLPLPPPDWVAQGEDTGIVKRGKGFVVASLKPRIVIDRTTGKEVQVEVAFVWIFRFGTDKEWDSRRLNMPHDSDKGLVEFHWRTDAVFSFDGFICWVDYHRGILLCDVCNSNPELRFLRFPGIEIWSCSDRALPTRFRTVSICGGRMKFVDVDNGRFRSTESDVCSITTWTLKMPQYEWGVDSVLQLGELWSHRNYQDSPLPQTVPTFPVVNMMEPNILHFIVKGPGFFDKAWMVTVDMKKKSLGPCQIYKNPVKEGEYSIDTSHVYPNSTMISSKITKCLNIPSDLDRPKDSAATDMEMHERLEAELQGGPIAKTRPMVQLLGGSPEDPLGHRGALKNILGAAWRKMCPKSYCQRPGEETTRGHSFE